MKSWYLGPLIFLALGSSAQVVEGQRLSEGFRTHDVGSLLTQAQPASQRTAHYQFPQVDCGGSMAWHVAEGAFVGAVSGWLTYELVAGIWRAGEGAKQDTRLRATLTLGGAGIGTLWVVYARSRC